MNRQMSDEDWEEIRREAEAKEKAAKEEYEIKMADLLKEIPEEFHSFVESTSLYFSTTYDNRELYGNASAIVDHLKLSIEKYKNRLVLSSVDVPQDISWVTFKE